MATTRKQSGFFIQSTFGSRGNYELVVPNLEGGFSHYWRDNDAGGFPWRGPFNFGGPVSEFGRIHGVSLIQSNYGRNLEVVAVVGEWLRHYARESREPFRWFGPTRFGNVVPPQVPAFIQGNFGSRGNFEVVVVNRRSGLSHYWRKNDESGNPWHGPERFAADIAFSGVSLIQSNFGPDNFEVVAVKRDGPGPKLLHYWKSPRGPIVWHGPTAVPGSEDALSNPSLIQSSYGTKGNFEVVAPMRSGGLGHFWRDNDAPDQRWSGPVIFGTDHHFLFVSLIQSNFGLGPDNNLAVVAISSHNRKFYYQRDDAGTWHEQLLPISPA